MRTGVALSMIACMMTLGTAGTARATEVPASLLEALRKVEADPPPRQLTRNAHFVVSDERAHFKFAEALKDRGGVFVGVGTDQNYLMAGWARPDVLFLMDFDGVIVDLHEVYRLSFLNSDRAHYREFWSAASTARVEALIAAANPDPARKARVLAAYRLSRGLVAWRLQSLETQYRKLGVPCFLTDDATYDYLAGMARSGRIIAVRGDLLGRKTMRQLAAAVRSSGRVIRGFYLSNCEGYFRYNDDFRTNLLELPIDDRTVFVRTYAVGPRPGSDGTYNYLVQGGENLRSWLRDRRVSSLHQVVQGARPLGIPGLLAIERVPGEPPATRPQPARKRTLQ